MFSPAQSSDPALIHLSMSLCHHVPLWFIYSQLSSLESCLSTGPGQCSIHQIHRAVLKIRTWFLVNFRAFDPELCVCIIILLGFSKLFFFPCSVKHLFKDYPSNMNINFLYKGCNGNFRMKMQMIHISGTIKAEV